MKTKLIALLLLTASLYAHERITLGPNGGRLIAIDSPTTPNAEFSVTKDNRFQIGFLDKNLKPLPVGKRKLTVTAGDRSNPKKLTSEIKDDLFITEVAPAGNDYHVIMQLREPGAAKGKTFRLHYNLSKCPECKKPEWLCACGGKESGKNIQPPAALEGLWAEINQHTKELREGVADKAYEAIDEVTEAFPVLATALPGKTDPAKKAEAGKLVDELKSALDGIREAFAARKPDDATLHLEAVEKILSTLKSLYPPAIANATLKE
ncbi:MAG: hypothetical protein K8R87_09710 [Verrucomicrobia bacterium]|nr:hypothetical protein [Verrucomicrobiota bacterium]